MRVKNIKLFVDAHAFDTEYQGIQTFIRELYRSLMEMHPDIDIYWGAYHTERISAAIPGVCASRLLAYKKPRGLSRFFVDIPAFIKKYRFDFAHFQYLSPLPQGSCRYIVTLHDVLYNTLKADFSWGYRFSRNILFRYSIRSAAIKTTVSAYSRDSISSTYNINANDIHIIPNGVNCPIKADELNKADAANMILRKYGVKNFILYVSRSEPRKNHALLLQKYLKLQLYKKNIALVFIGSAAVKVDKLQKLINSLNDEERRMFHWYTNVPPNDLTAFYLACKVFVYPTKAEGFGLPPLEAAVCRAPVLCSRATAMADFDFFNPDMFDPHDEDDFEQKLSHIIAHPPTGAFLNEVACRAAQKYSWHNSSQVFYSLLLKHA